MADKRTTTVRLGEQTRADLKRAAYVLDVSQNKVIEEALQEFFRSRNLTGGYQLTFTAESVVLLHTSEDKPPKVLEVHQRNGVPPAEVGAQYTTKLGEPVRVIVQD